MAFSTLHSTLSETASHQWSVICNFFEVVPRRCHVSLPVRLLFVLLTSLSILFRLKAIFPDRARLIFFASDVNSYFGILFSSSCPDQMTTSVSTSVLSLIFSHQIVFYRLTPSIFCCTSITAAPYWCIHSSRDQARLLWHDRSHCSTTCRGSWPNNVPESEVQRSPCAPSPTSRHHQPPL